MRLPKVVFSQVDGWLMGPPGLGVSHIVAHKVEKWIRRIPLINGRFKLNFDGSKINNISASVWVIKDSLRDGFLATIYNGFTNLEIEGDSKVIIDYYNRRNCSPNSIILLMENIWRLS